MATWKIMIGLQGLSTGISLLAIIIYVLTPGGKNKMSLKVWAIIMFVLFLGSMIVTGIMSARKSSKGTAAVDEEYYLGGRDTGPVFLAFSYVTGSVSAAAFMGEPGLMSKVGWPYYWIVVAIIPGMVFPAILLLKKLISRSEGIKTRYGSFNGTNDYDSRRTARCRWLP